MKKAIILLIFTVWSVTTARTQTIKLLSPESGETWPAGQVRIITWQAQGISGSVKIILRRGGAKVGDIAANVPAAPGSFSWTVGTLLNGTPPPAGDGFIVRVRTADNLFGDDSRSFRISRLVSAQPHATDSPIIQGNLQPAPGDPPVFQGPARLPDLSSRIFTTKKTGKYFPSR